MELILLSVFGTASLLMLELCGLYYERWVREPLLTSSELPTALSGNQPGGTAIMRTITEGGLHCSDAANDADATTIRRVMSSGTHRESTGE
jgi:hypothetical protein